MGEIGARGNATIPLGRQKPNGRALKVCEGK